MKKIFLLTLIFPLLLSAQDSTENQTDQPETFNKKMFKQGIDTTKYVPKGLNVGDIAPVINTVNLQGKEIHSDNILKNKKIVVIFYRGKWCPVCNKYLNNLNDSLKYITDKNAEVLVIGPETFENAESINDKIEANFQLIPDTNLKILTDYDVLFNVTRKYQGKIKTFLFTDIAKNNNQEDAILPVPATYIIGKNGKIIYRHFDYDYSVRATVKDIIDNL